MTIAETEKVDALGEEISTGDVVLSIFDHLDWTDEQEHLLLLQEKINSYLDFIETGQIQEDFPKAEGARLKIQILAKYPLSEAAEDFLAKASFATNTSGISLVHRVH